MSYIALEDSVFGVGFLERLEAGAKPVSITQGPETRDVVNSIKKNIANVLNTRTGGAQSSPGLGLIDFNDATLESLDLSLRVKLAIKQCLETYEPRLTNILVSSDYDEHSPLTLRFNIVATVNSEALHEKVQLSLLLDQNRQYRVL
ncbi:lysozyme [Salinivibrio proteolyticus]|jgi:type VI secretion system protein|uniref:Type VI secretion system baseplate subunit TssE n=1 Tax=Salinivibrio costicola TaxID=51367 RepID=A0ABX6K7F8_SALCS|nr:MULTISPECIES: type VI secretion system baseplate subunit TssE [Salinivibrio]OOF20865.1 lysozyme [Salinivibrio sp. IB872]OOF24507.1 lysozyme [Salinivibrio proteolyticus]PCE65674.1 lysozyme [Salinivibrio sp. YCSC6]QCF37874.1 type VI secretion system baseplate subunit TssE [Salinivibrio sp. YCSC6]QIR07465.1 type VI secretion system baseplate subunit TssE [Salinivibrio costicola]